MVAGNIAGSIRRGQTIHRLPGVKGTGWTPPDKGQGASFHYHLTSSPARDYSLSLLLPRSIRQRILMETKW